MYRDLNDKKADLRDYNPNEHRYIHSYGFAPRNPFVIEAENIRLFSNAAGFSIIMMFMIRSMLAEPLSHLLFSLFGLVGSVGDNIAVAYIMIELASSITFCLSIFIPFFIYMKLVKIPHNTAIPTEIPKLNILIPCIFIALSLSAMGAFTSNALSVAFSNFGIYIFAPTSAPSGSAFSYIIYILNVVLLPSLVEEWAFRGVLLQSLRRFGDGYAILLSSIIFALAHANISQIPTTFLVGIIMAICVVMTGSVWSGVIIHFVNNALVILFTFIISNASPENIDLITLAKNAVYIILGILSVIYLAKNNPNIFNLRPVKSYIATRQKIFIYFSTLAMISVILLITAIALQYVTVQW